MSFGKYSLAEYNSAICCRDCIRFNCSLKDVFKSFSVGMPDHWEACSSSLIFLATSESLGPMVKIYWDVSHLSHQVSAKGCLLGPGNRTIQEVVQERDMWLPLIFLVPQESV